ncbi:MAG: single-stranded-DNA-specific exonuclease RecJ, partial [Anaerolineales bacterium]
MQRIWKYPEPTPPEVAEALAVYEPILRDLLYQRGFGDAQSARDYLQKAMPSHLREMEISGAQGGATILAEAMDADLPIAIYGDYDADGVS